MQSVYFTAPDDWAKDQHGVLMFNNIERREWFEEFAENHLIVKLVVYCFFFKKPWGKKDSMLEFFWWQLVHPVSRSQSYWRWRSLRNYCLNFMGFFCLTDPYLFQWRVKNLEDLSGVRVSYRPCLGNFDVWNKDTPVQSDNGTEVI